MQLSEKAVEILRLEIAKQACKDYMAAYARVKRLEEHPKSKQAMTFAIANFNEEWEYMHSDDFEKLIDSNPDRLIHLLERAVNNKQRLSNNKYVKRGQKHD